MDKRNLLLALVLVVCLVSVAGLALMLEPAAQEEEAQQPQGSYSIVISEICTKNETVIADNTGKYRDYIELYNTGDALNLEGFCLTDGKVKSAPLPAMTLGKGAYRVLFLGDSVTGFALGASGGDTIQLLDPRGSIVAQANTAAMTEDQVMLYDKGNYLVSTEATPGFSNDQAGLAAFREGSVGESGLVISELLTANVSALPDERGIFCDVVELYNESAETVELGGYYLSDAPAQRFRYRLPERSVAPGEYLIIYCDGENYMGENGEIHANFALSAGETLTLTDSLGCYASVDTAYHGDDVSLARTEDGSFTAASVSLGYPGDAEGVELFIRSRTDTDSALVINEVLLSSAQIPYKGSICDAVEIRNRSEAKVSTLGWYLSDGGDPYAYALPEASLEPGECMVILCTPHMAGFSLAEGETLKLTGPDFRYAMPVTCVAGEAGMSISRQESADGVTYTHSAVTLGYPNEAENHALYLQESEPKGLRISELMSDNNSYVKGAYAATCDWIEIYNASAQDISLSDYCLTDSAGNLHKYPLPEGTLAAGEYCIVLLSEETKNLPKGYGVLPFALSSDGERLYLTKGDAVEDYVFVPDLDPDTSYGRPDGSMNFTVLEKVTPGSKNSAQAQVTAAPIAVTAPGSYDGVEYVDIVLEGEGTIYYTTDCSKPSRYSRVYTEPIRITQTTVLRVMCRAEGKQNSETLDLTYLVNEYDVLPVVSIVTPNSNLWDHETGIYVEGPNPGDVYPYETANYWQDWEKEASVSLYEPDGSGFSLACGLKIFGARSRTLSKKSLVCFFREEYGEGELEYPLFGEEGLDSYEAFVLRSGGQDAFRARIRDEMITSLVAEYTDVAVQKYKPVVVYLNGRYFGLHYIREKLNEHYVAGNYGVEPEDVTMTEWNGRYCQEYWDLITYARTNDLSQQAHYDYICSQINLQQYIDYMIAQMWIANTDNGNVKFFTTTDGVWHWIMFDTDISFMDPEHDSLERHLDPAKTGGLDHTSKTLAVELMDNAQFREMFIQRMAWQMDTIWTQENVLAQIDKLEATISETMVKECERWNVTYEGWQREVGYLRDFAMAREGYLLEHIQDYFDLTTEQMRGYGFHVD